ncbi:MAG: hypothetical protein A2X56_01485 [Nitrospirae bacterium GWC2_57_13]|nr:MAG: hypothetical protein A2072_03110 [Nitrospirae bacterium GWC1_57_7]OGW27088.1 MAG: hypothetical protein A2X56_01485 [Nitrospirae bacterium GWC2_57_13]OGW45646.1 MAG: hypothetical protein A2X57_03205 [Nitrospirae bacterium GWD2_57_8]HAR45748.1 hypothetical protein [Nitrospiraceae bacterium]
MEKSLSEIVAEIARAKQTGILSLSVKNDSSLFKIFFRDGAVYHLTYGTCKDMECVSNLTRLDLDTGFMHLGATVDKASTSMPTTEEIITRIKSADKKVKWSAPGAGAATDADKPAQKTAGAAGKASLEAIEQELINVVGPIAPMLLEQVFDALRIKKGQPVPEPQMRQIISQLGDNLPEEQKEAFLAKFS